MRNRYLRYLAALAALGVIAVGIFVFLYLRPLPVEVARLEKDVRVQVFGLGTVEARVISKVGFEVGAALTELHADQGDHVKAGSVLARLHSAEQRAKLSKAKAGVVQAKAALAQASAQVLEARAVLGQREQADKRRQVLVAAGKLSVESAQEAHAEKKVAAAKLSLASSQVEVAKASIEDARAQEQYETVLLEHHTLVAPYDAIIVERHKELGTVLTPGEPLFTLVDPTTVWGRAFVDEASAGEIHLDQSAEVRLRSLPREVFRGHVARIDIESDRVSEERRVYIKCDQCPREFHLGEQAEVTITLAHLKEALLVPELAVESFRSTTGVVWTVERGRLNRREVSFGHKTLDGRLQIIGDLPADTSVVTRLRAGLRVGRAAKIITQATP